MSAAKWFGFLPGSARLMSIVLLVQTAAFYSLPPSGQTPVIVPLAGMPHQIGGWTELQDERLDPAVIELLAPDDYLSRLYVDGRTQAHLLVIYFKSNQKSGFGPHSPQVCLPGAGWIPASQSEREVETPDGVISVNYLVARRGAQQSVVVYWYQTARRAITGEIMARLSLIADSLRYGRTDTALVRVVVPVLGANTDMATQSAFGFASAVTPLLGQHILKP